MRSRTVLSCRNKHVFELRFWLLSSLCGFFLLQQLSSGLILCEDWSHCCFRKLFCRPVFSEPIHDMFAMSQRTLHGHICFI